MIVSHRHRFVFLKTRKTAGTSVEIALSWFCGPDDIITRIMPDDERLRAELGYPGRQNDRVSSGRLLNHTSADDVRRHIGDGAWDRYPAKRIGLPSVIELPRAKSGYRPADRHYRDLLGPPTRRRIERICARECAEFSYRWDDAAT